MHQMQTSKDKAPLIRISGTEPPVQRFPNCCVAIPRQCFSLPSSSGGSTSGHWPNRPRTLLLTLLFVFLGSYGLLPLVYHGALSPAVHCGGSNNNNNNVSEKNDISVIFQDGGDGNGYKFADDAVRLESAPEEEEQQQQMTSNSIAALSAEFFHKVRFRRTKRRLPQCIIIGVRKCGTRALLEFLNLHPRIVKATQEVHFFDDDSKYSLGLEWYRRKMPYSFADQITVEKSPSYFVTTNVPQRMYAMNPRIKLLLIVREPITRAISDYTQIQANKMAKGKSYDSFESLAMNSRSGEINVDYKALHISLYANYLSHWFDVFPREALHVVDGDRLIADPLAEIRKIEDFLGLQHRIAKDNFYFNKTKGFYCLRNATTEKCLSEAKGRKHPLVSPQVVDKLKRFFAPHNERFFDMIGQNFSWPKPIEPM